MQITIDNKTLKRIYDSILTVYYARLEDPKMELDESVKRLWNFKNEMTSIMDINSLFFKIEEDTLVNSPFINKYSKTERNTLNIDFSVSGFLMIRRCIYMRIQVLNAYACEMPDDHKVLSDIGDSLKEAHETLAKMEGYLTPLMN